MFCHRTHEDGEFEEFGFFEGKMRSPGHNNCEASDSKGDSDRLLTTPEVCEYLSVSRVKLYQLVACSEFPVCRLGSRSLRFDLADVRSWLQKRKTGKP